MGIIVPEYTTKWGMTMPVYISHASKEIRIAPLHGQAPDNQWVLYGDFAVYRSREDRLKNPYGAVMDTIHVVDTVTSAAFETSTTFQLLYAKLLEMFPDAEHEHSSNQDVTVQLPTTLTPFPVPTTEPTTVPEPDPTTPAFPVPSDPVNTE